MQHLTIMMNEQQAQCELKESQMKLEKGLGVESLEAMQLYNDNRATLQLNMSQ